MGGDCSQEHGDLGSGPDRHPRTDAAASPLGDLVSGPHDGLGAAQPGKFDVAGRIVKQKVLPDGGVECGTQGGVRAREHSRRGWLAGNGVVPQRGGLERDMGGDQMRSHCATVSKQV